MAAKGGFRKWEFQRFGMAIALPLMLESLDGDMMEQTMETATSTDFELARAAAAGDQSAFDDLYQQHHQKVYSICLRMLRNPTDAEDVTQEVFIRVSQRISIFRGDSAFTTWLYRLTVNSVLMYLRTKRRRHREKPTEDGVIENWMEHRRLWRQREIPIIDRLALKQAMALLPTGYRHVFQLHDLEGFDHKQVGGILGISSGTSKSQLHKARARMKKLLSKRYRMRRPLLAETSPDENGCGK